jgi:hypothetical protein
MTYSLRLWQFVWGQALLFASGFRAETGLSEKNTSFCLPLPYSEYTNQLVLQVKQAFNTKGLVPLDTLLLQRFFIRELYVPQARYWWPDTLYRNWPYAMPEDVYVQLQKNEANSTETKVLIDILNEQAYLFLDDPQYIACYTVHECDKFYTRRKIFMNFGEMRELLSDEIRKLKNDDRYQQYHDLLPELVY